MNPFFGLLLVPCLVLTSSGCGSGSTDGGPSGSGTTFSCLIQITSPITSPMCQFYVATGPDASRMISSLQAGCVNQGVITAKVVNSCPTDGSVGGCKTPVQVTGGANVQLDVTNFYYAADADASAFSSPATPAAVQRRCATEMGVFVPAP